MSLFNEHISSLWEERKIKQYKVEACLNADTAFVKKLDKSGLQVRSEHLHLQAERFKVDLGELLFL